MPAEAAARVLGSHLGIPHLAPATELALDQDALTDLLTETSVKGNTQLEKALFSYADAVTTKHFGESIYYRGIVEFSNVCQNDCGYCGIRKHMGGVRRYTIPIPEVVEAARWAYDNRMGTLMLQAGELHSPARMEYLLKLIPAVREATVEMEAAQRGLDLGVSSVGGRGGGRGSSHVSSSSSMAGARVLRHGGKGSGCRSSGSSSHHHGLMLHHSAAADVLGCHSACDTELCPVVLPGHAQTQKQLAVFSECNHCTEVMQAPCIGGMLC
jgi:hypothetical protein